MKFRTGTLLYLGGTLVRKLIYITKDFTTGQTLVEYVCLININKADEAHTDFSMQKLYLNKDGCDAASGRPIILRAPTDADIDEFLRKLPKYMRKNTIKLFLEALAHKEKLTPRAISKIRKIASKHLADTKGGAKK